MIGLEALFSEIDRLHNARPCADQREIEHWQAQAGFTLPADLQQFFRRYQSVRLFDSGDGPVYRFVPLSQVRPTRLDIYGRDEHELGPAAWFTICDVMDGNYIAMDLASRQGDTMRFIDCFHETFAQPGQSTIVAMSFTELLDRALKSAGSLFYLQKDFKGYGDGMPLTAENASLRIENPEALRKGWLARFSTSGESYSKFFADDDYGGKQRSFAALEQFVREKSGS